MSFPSEAWCLEQLEGSLEALRHELKSVEHDAWRNSPIGKEGRGYEAFQTSWKVLELAIEAADKLFVSRSYSRQARYTPTERALVENALAASLELVRDRCRDFDSKAGDYRV